MTQGKNTDWPDVERLYRLGDLSIREIGRLHNVSEATIRAHARAAVPPWIRNLKERVRSQIDERLAVEQAEKAEGRKPGAPMSDQAIVDAAAAAGTAVVRRQRTTVNEAHERVVGILMRIKAMFERQENIDDMELAIMEETADPTGEEEPLLRMARLARRRRLLQLISLPAQINQIQGVAGALARIIPLERITFGLSEKGERGENEGNTVADLLQELSDQVSGTRFQPK
jgi:hypothetical protein